MSVCVFSEHCAKFSLMSFSVEGNFLGDVFLIFHNFCFLIVFGFSIVSIHFVGFFRPQFNAVLILNKVPELNSKFMKH